MKGHCLSSGPTYLQLMSEILQSHTRLALCWHKERHVPVLLDEAWSLTDLVMSHHNSQQPRSVRNSLASPCSLVLSSSLPVLPSCFRLDAVSPVAEIFMLLVEQGVHG